jgi:hypothetical protein
MTCLATMAALGGAAAARAQTPTGPRPVAATDIYRLRTVRDAQLSPEGTWVAYTVTTIDSARDRSETDIWMAS